MLWFVTSPSASSRLGAVILTGGAATRLGGRDKATLELGGTTLLEHALAAVGDAAEVVVVGVPVPTSLPVTWTREEPSGGGPAAGLLAGLDRMRPTPDLVAVLAVDMPRAVGETFGRLLAALEPSYDAAVLVDGTGRDQPLCGIYRAAALLKARPGDPAGEHGLSVRALVSGLVLARVAAVGAEADDVDTWADLDRLGQG
jgi:molybdopterin-guanine dinucleotide biosynthesis protein A